MKQILSPEEAIFNLCDGIYGPIRRGLIDSGRNEDDIIKFGRRNRLSHFMALKNGDSDIAWERWPSVRETLLNEYAGYQQQLFLGLKRVKAILKGVPFAVIKTFSTFPHLTHDIDIVVPHSDIVTKVAKAVTDANKAEPHSLLIDINWEVNWGGARVVSQDFIWKNLQDYTINEAKYLVPNSTLDTLIRIGHIPFELAHIKLGELLHIYHQSRSAAWEEIG